MKNNFKISCASIKKYNDFIIEIEYNNESDIELIDAKEIHQVFLKLSNKKPFAILIDGRNKYVNFSDEAKKFFANDKEVTHLKIAMAIIITNLPNRIIAKFYSSFYKPNYKIKIFPNRNDALNWLNEIYDKI